MRRGLLAFCLVASMLLAGCTGPSTAAWGSGSNAVDVNFSMDKTSVKSGLSGETTTTNVIPMGCTPGTEGGELNEGSGSSISFTGYLAASHFYDAHNKLMGAQGLDFGVTTAVAIQSMRFDEASAVTNGDGPRIDVKEWNMPLSPKTGAGSVNLESPSQTEASKWFVLGLIPTSEEVLKGMTSLDEWHQGVSIHGYLVDDEGDGNNPAGYARGQHAERLSNDCSFLRPTEFSENVYVLVTGITLEGASVSANGDADDEWVQGDVPLLGRGGFILFFLVAGLGGSVGLFIVSTGMVKRSASKSMATLIGSEGMKKAASVKNDAKAAKMAGMESPSERKSRMKKDEAKDAPKKERAPPKASKKKDENPMGGFDLDSVLASTSTSTGPGGNAPAGRKSSVVEATDRNIIVQNITYNIQDSAVAGDISPPKPPVRRRKAVKKAKSAEPEEPSYESPAPEPQYEEEDEDFSDFSL
jgi:hypothetical protein